MNEPFIGNNETQNPILNNDQIEFSESNSSEESSSDGNSDDSFFYDKINYSKYE